jgi:hypothetical protein
LHRGSRGGRVAKKKIDEARTAAHSPVAKHVKSLRGVKNTGKAAECLALLFYVKTVNYKLLSHFFPDLVLNHIRAPPLMIILIVYTKLNMPIAYATSSSAIFHPA